eukprot:GAHX01001946.1.p1 GENE.GAHX01001946.1~~GAHX01001946.1.p1  ORF type:complete len:455 (+),score=45.36 GAHX01001946.1:50-1414(+)
MYLFYLAMILSGIHISMALTSNGLYVKHYFNGSGKIATLVTIFHMMPWTFKFIYGFVLDRHLATTTRKLKLLIYLPVFLFAITITPLFIEFETKPFYLFAFLISVPNALFHTTFYSYFYQGIRTGVYEKGILGRALSCHYTGCLIGNIIYLLLGFIYMENLENTIFSAYLILALVCILLFVINTALYRNRLINTRVEENKLEDFSDEVVGITQNNWLELLRAMYTLIKQKNYAKIILFLFVSSFIPTFTSYYPMFLLSEKQYGGLGAHYSSQILSRIVYYISCIIGPSLYQIYKKRRLHNLQENEDGTEECHTPSWFKQEVVFAFFIAFSFIIYFTELIFYSNKLNSTFVKVFLYQCFVVLIAILLSMRASAVFEFACDSCVNGLEGSLYSIWSSFLYLSGILGDLLGLLLVTLFDRFYGYGKNDELKWESLKPASYVAYVVSVICTLYGYYID